jgi:hypothetical protein
LVHVSPNAMKGSFRVSYPRVERNGRIDANLLDANGQALDVDIRVDGLDEERVDITISNTQSGIYHLKIFDGKTCVIKKIILQ